MRFVCRSILFDLDGVLVDSTRAVARVWRHWALQQGLDPELVIHQAHGRRSIETIRAVAPHLDANCENLIVEDREIEDKDGVTVLPGAFELLGNLPVGAFSIVTSATRALANARLRHAGLPIPQRFISAEDVLQGKPFPEPYLKGAALLGVAPQDCLVFEDTTSGIKSARTAGMRVIALTTTYPMQELAEADAIIASLAQVKLQLIEGTLSLTVIPVTVTA